MTKTATANEKRISGQGGEVWRARAAKTPQSRGVSPFAFGFCQRCGTKLSGRQRSWCGDRCRVAAARDNAQIDGPRPAARTRSRARRRTAPALLGSRDPAFCLVPRHTSSLGPEAVELMRRAGTELDQWQMDVLEGAMGRRGSRWSAPEVVLLAPRQNGKSEIVAAAALQTAVSGPKKLIVISSHETKTNEELFIRVRDVVETESFEVYEPRVYTANGRESITFNNGSRIKFHARAKHQGRGFSPDLIVVDEAFVLSDASWSSLKPSVSAAKAPQLWLVSSAPHPDSAVLRRYCLRGRAAEDTDLYYAEWSAPLDAAPDSLAAWVASNPALGRISLETVASELKALDPEAFGRERLGWWREDETPSVFPAGTWEALAFLGPLETTESRALGLDVTPVRDHATIVAAADVLGDKALVEVLAAEKGTSWIVPRLRELAASYPGSTIVLDKLGPAASLVEELRSAGLTICETTTAEFAVACAGFYDRVLAGTVIHRADPVLDQAVQNAEMRPLGDRFAWKRRTAGGDISPLVASSLAVWALPTQTKPLTYWVL